MPLEFQGKWFRVAGIARRIRDLLPPPHWRFEVDGSDQQYLLHDFRFVGNCTPDNNCPGVNPSAKNDQLIAWIACFGNVVVTEDGEAEFTLLDPTTPCPWN